MDNSNILIKSIFASTIAGITEVSLVHPIDVVKTLLQQNKFHELKSYRFNDYYRGYFVRLGSIAPMRTIFWSSQHILKEHYNIKNAITIGTITGFLQTIIDAPIENIKINQINKNDAFTLNAKNLYNGFNVHLIRNIIFADMIIVGKNLSNEPNPLLIGTFGIVGAVISHPFDTIKTLKQANIIKDYVDAIKSINMQKNNIDKIKFLYKGGLNRAGIAFINMSLGSYLFMKLIN